VSAKHFSYSRHCPKAWLSWTTHRKLKQVPKISGFVLGEFGSLKKSRTVTVPAVVGGEEVQRPVTSLLNKFFETNRGCRPSSPS